MLSDPENLQVRCSDDPKSGQKRPVSEVLSEDEEDDDDEAEGASGVPDVPTDRLTFKPIYYISYWKEQSTMRKRATVAILLPSGAGGDEDDVLLRYVRAGNYSEVKVKWPSYIVDLILMHRPYLHEAAENFMSDSHPQNCWISGSSSKHAQIL